jgi:hypothetical protein
LSTSHKLVENILLYNTRALPDAEKPKKREVAFPPEKTGAARETPAPDETDDATR